jgi:hypothetical protein
MLLAGEFFNEVCKKRNLGCVHPHESKAVKIGHAKNINAKNKRQNL